MQCGQCGEEGCGSIPNYDGTNCCINGVLNNRDDCTVTGSAPCVIDAAGGEEPGAAAAAAVVVTSTRVLPLSSAARLRSSFLVT